MLQVVTDAPKAVLFDLIRQNGKSSVAAFMNDFYQHASATSSRCEPIRARPASRAPTIASEDSFADVIDAVSDTGHSIADVAVFAPNALNLTETQLVCIHREFEKIG